VTARFPHPAKRSHPKDLSGATDSLSEASAMARESLDVARRIDDT
jgi:hypothetical protein